MATRSNDDVGRLIMANATPFLWKRSAKKPKGMSAWTFPENVHPGEAVTVAVAFNHANGAHGQASYQVEVEKGVSGDGNPTFTVSATPGGLSVNLPAEMRQPGWFAVPPAPHKVAEAGWQKGCAVSFTLGCLGGDHPNLRGGHVAQSFHGLTLAAPNGVPDVGDDRSSHGEVFPEPGTPSADRDSDEGGGSRGLGGLLGGFGRMLKASTEGMGNLLNDCGIGTPPRPAGGKGEGAWTAEWMKMYAAALADLKLSDMSLPGSHDSGTTKMHNPVVGPWATTQNLDLRPQLMAGVRVIDIRVGFVGAEDQKNDGVDDGIAVVHDKHRTTLSLRQALRVVKKFVKEHPREVVLLDFHRFPGLGHGAPHEKAASVVVETLGNTMILPKHRNLPFKKLVNQQPGRIAVLWNAVEARNPHFWPGVRQAWTGAETLSALHDMAKTELVEKKGVLWSLPLVLPAGVPRPVPHIAEQLDDWMAVGGVWQEHANIVAVDFVEETQIVRNCVGACLMKAARASAAGGAAPAHGGGGGGGGGGKKGGGK